MRRCLAEEMVALEAFDERISARPDLGFVVATAELDPADCSVTVNVSDVGCSPLCLVSIAAELLAAASEMIEGAAPDTRQAAADLIGAIASARQALGAEASCERLP